jgi:hypothetical protein
MTLQQTRALAELEKAVASVGARLRSLQVADARLALDSDPQKQTADPPLTMWARVKKSLPTSLSLFSSGSPKPLVTLEEGVIGDTLKEKIAWHLDYLGKKDLLLNLDLRGVSGFDPEKHKRLRGCTLDESEARCWYQKMAESKHTAFKWADISIKSRTCVQNVAMAREEKVTSDRFMALSISIERMIDGIKIYSEPFAVHGEIITTTAGNRHDLSETDRNSLISTIVMSAGPLSSITSAAIIAVEKCDGGGLRVKYAITLRDAAATIAARKKLETFTTCTFATCTSIKITNWIKEPDDISAKVRSEEESWVQDQNSYKRYFYQ